MSKVNYAKLSVAELVARYEKTALEHFEAVVVLDTPTANRKMDIIIGIGRELHARGRDAHAALLPLLEHENPGVRTQAAADALLFAPDRAVSVLEAIRRDFKGTGIGADAGGILDRWRNGESQLP
ncbi:MAG: DUF2019 domain-containing protein [Pseudomonadota bacterium]